MNRLLCLTSFPLIYFSCITKHTHLNKMFFTLFITSQLFWYTCIKDSIFHKLDAIVAKITIGYTFYILYNHKVNIIPLGFIPLWFSLRSNIESSIEWKSPKHLINHSIFHITAIIFMSLAEL